MAERRDSPLRPPEDEDESGGTSSEERAHGN